MARPFLWNNSARQAAALHPQTKKQRHRFRGSGGDAMEAVEYTCPTRPADITLTLSSDSGCESSESEEEHGYLNPLPPVMEWGGYQWQTKQYLGEGSFSRVYRAQPLEPEKEPAVTAGGIALKMIPFVKGRHAVEYYEKEVTALVHLMNSCLNNNTVYPRSVVTIVANGRQEYRIDYGAALGEALIPMGLIGLELLSRQSLHDHIVAQRRRAVGKCTTLQDPCAPFSLAECLHLAKQLTTAVAFIHHHNVAHLDIKSTNIAYDPQQNTLTLYDFGFAECRPRQPKGEPWRVDTSAGTALFMSPEQLLQPLIAYEPLAADMWQVGHVLYELMTGQQFFEHRCTSLKDLRELVLQEKPPNPCFHSAVQLHGPQYMPLLDKTLVYRPAANRARASTLDIYVHALAARYPWRVKVPAPYPSSTSLGPPA